MATARKILITGATGKQGGAVLKTLLSSPKATKFSYIAVTRDPTSASATRLAQQSSVSLVKGGFTEPKQIFDQIKELVWGSFIVTAVGKNEISEGKAMIDQAVTAGVKHVVFTSADRNDNSKPGPVPHLASKHVIEQHLMARAKETGMTYTILRPVAFMDNASKDFLGKGFAAMWKQMGSKKLQLIASEDIGYWGAKAFVEAEGWGRNNAVSIAGDELTYDEGAAIFEKTVGRPMPTTFGFLGRLIKTASHEMGAMFKWFEDVGFGVDVDALRKEVPQMKTWGQWLEQSSQFRGEIQKR